MSSPQINEKAYSDLKNKGQNMLKKWVFDLVAIIIIAASFLLEFGSLAPNDFDLWRWAGDTAVFFFCAMSLSSVYYAKGTYKAEGADEYRAAVAAYSQAATIRGEDRSRLPVFCKSYTENALKDMQDAILSRACVSVAEFYEPRSDGKPPIATMDKPALIAEFGRERTHIILHAKRVHVKGLTAESLMSDRDAHDPTAMRTRKGMKERYSAKNAVMYIFMGIFAAWFGLRLANDFTIAAFAWFFFRIATMIVRSLFAYLTGFEDIATHWRDTLIQKTDILNEFDAWLKSAEKVREESTEI